MMRRITRKIDSIRRKIDIYSPIPAFYQFVMSDKERDIFDRTVAKSKVYLEFGFGGSTLRVIRKSRARIFTVESSAQWISQMRRYRIIPWLENVRLTIFHADIGPTIEWGYPEPGNSSDLFESYSSAIFSQIECSIVDRVLIDGRFRVACTLKTLLECHNPALQILFHDFWNREHYHPVLKYLETEDRADTLGLFSVRKDIDLKEIEREYQAYKLDPR